MNIWLIQIGEPLPIKDHVRWMRTAHFANILRKRGHTVLWWASAFDHLQKTWIYKKDTDYIIHDNLRIKALKGIGYKKNISLYRFLDHRSIAKRFKKLAPLEERPDLVVASTPSYDLAFEAVTFAKERNIPIIIDIRDEWPDLFLQYIPYGLRTAARWLLYKEFQMIKQTMRMADGLTAMMDSLLGWGLKYAGRDKTENDRVYYLGARRGTQVERERHHKLADIPANKFIVVFIGTFVHNNDPSILIDCAHKLKNSDIHFVLAGDGEYYSEIKTKTALLPNVSMPGWLNQHEMEVLLKRSHVGICPAAQQRNAFPNKAFSYFSAGLPVITAFQGDLKEIIEKYKIGYYYPPNDVDALVAAILRLNDNRSLWTEMSARAQKVFDEIFDADKIYTAYAEYIEKIGSQY